MHESYLGGGKRAAHGIALVTVLLTSTTLVEVCFLNNINYVTEFKMRKIHGLLAGISLLASVSALAVGEDDPNNKNSRPSKVFNGGTIHEEYRSDFDLLPAETVLNIFRNLYFNDLNSLSDTSRK